MSSVGQMTPGPWNVELSGDTWWVYATTSDHRICYLSWQNGEANARAIAALPDLVEALQHLVKVPTRLSGEQLAKAKQALAKLEGGEA